MELVRQSAACVETLSDQEELTLVAGKRLQIRTGTPVEELLDEEVPEGKQWAVTITVHVVETDAE